MKGRKVASVCAAAALVLSLMTPVSFAADNHNPDLMGRVVVIPVEQTAAAQEISTKQTINSEMEAPAPQVVRVEFQAKTTPETVLGIISELSLKYDETRLEILNVQGSASVQALLPTRYPATVPSVATGGQLSSVDIQGGFSALSTEGTTYVNLCPEYEGTTAEDSRDWITLGSFCLKLRSGTWEDGLPEGSLQFLTAEECRTVGFGAAMRLSNKRGDGFFYEDPNATGWTMEQPQLLQGLGGSVQIVGTMKEGETLTADISQITPTAAREGLTIQWNRNGEPITEALGSTYVLKKEDAGQKISVTAAPASAYVGTIDSAEYTIKQGIKIKGSVSLTEGDAGLASVLLVGSGNTVGSQAKDIYRYEKQQGDLEGTVSPGAVKTDASFTVDDVEPGTYTILIRKPGALYYMKQNVTVSSDQEELVLDPVTLCAGDLNEDGVINNTDKGLVVHMDNFLKRPGTAGQEAALPAADLNNDKIINNTDKGIVVHENNFLKTAAAE